MGLRTQFALALPGMLVAGRDWRTLGFCGAAFACLSLLPLARLGWGYWPLWAEAVEAQHLRVKSLDHAKWQLTWSGLFVAAMLEAEAARQLQCIMSAIVVGLVALVAARR